MIARRIRVYGVVQGVGFRPTVSRHAAETGICGSVCNRGPYVEIFAQEEASRVAAFLDALEHRPPPRAAILKVDVKEAEIRPLAGFQIIESAKTGGEIFIPPDIAVCETCKAELFDPANRRYLHPFINCTCCGPRLTILDGLPYDRERTSMGAFPLCPDCAAEYHDPASRRYDAQPVCCPDCGPEVCLLGRTERGRTAITAARRTIRAGGIVAVKGIGGFHLCCDATNPEAVLLLRARKRRPRKPFAVMVRDMETAVRECVFGAAEAEILDGHQKPILLLPRRADGKICPQTAPDNPRLGVMLPYAPVQLLLFDYDDGLQMPDCLVMTSGNESGAPICRDDAEARQALTPLCDCILSHNREIRIRADDTVMDSFQGQPYMIRRSRGWAPLPVWTGGGFHGQVLAVGGELKNCFCIGINELFYPSPYVGDLGDVRTAEALEETIRRFQTLLEAKPEAVACDLHPGYHSAALSREMGLPVVPVQHHYAHILSCMAENDSFAPTLGLSFDGTGYGTDGTIWGGELLECSLSGFERLGSVTPFLQAGGRPGCAVGLARCGRADFWPVPGTGDGIGENRRAFALRCADGLRAADDACPPHQLRDLHQRGAAVRRGQRHSGHLYGIHLRRGGGHRTAICGAALRGGTWSAGASADAVSSGFGGGRAYFDGYLRTGARADRAPPCGGTRRSAGVAVPCGARAAFRRCLRARTGALRAEHRCAQRRRISKYAAAGADRTGACARGLPNAAPPHDPTE